MVRGLRKSVNRLEYRDIYKSGIIIIMVDGVGNRREGDGSGCPCGKG